MPHFWRDRNVLTGELHLSRKETGGMRRGEFRSASVRGMRLQAVGVYFLTKDVDGGMKARDWYKRGTGRSGSQW